MIDLLKIGRKVSRIWSRPWSCYRKISTDSAPGKKTADSYRELIEVFATWKNSEAVFIKSLLDSGGVESYIHNLYYPSLTPVGSAAVPIRIMIPANEQENMEKAEEIIKEYLKT